MKSFKTALLLIASGFVLFPAASWAQVPDHVQTTTPKAQVSKSQSALSKSERLFLADF